MREAKEKTTTTPKAAKRAMLTPRAKGFMSAEARRQVSPAGFDGFLADVLAPIPKGEEQANTAAFKRAIRADLFNSKTELSKTWSFGVAEVNLAQAAHLALFNAGGDLFASAERVKRQVERQCLIPAPTEKELRWKKQKVKWLSPIPREVAQAIAADERRFGVDVRS